MKNYFVVLLALLLVLITAVFLFKEHDKTGETSSSAGHAKPSPLSPSAPTTAPKVDNLPASAAQQVPSKVEEQTTAMHQPTATLQSVELPATINTKTEKLAPPPPSSEQAALKTVAQPKKADLTTTEQPEDKMAVLPTDTSTSQPIPLVGKQKVPRIDIIGQEGTEVFLAVYFDSKLICNISGNIDAKTHRPFAGGFIVEGACYSNKILSKGQHEYKVSGKITLPGRTQHEVSVSTGQKNMSGVIQPAIKINEEGEVEVKLAVD